MSTALEKAKQIDEISKSAMAAFESPESFEKELSVARSISDMRVALTPDIMADVMGLMNTSIGFRTDRDPKVTPLDKDQKPMTPYPVEVVRDVFIESRLRGFHCINNEFNIIAGRFYGCLNGFERLVKKSARCTDFKDNYSVPVMVGDRGAVVEASASWLQDGVKQTLERKFAVRVNSGMGADAIVGKAKRKLLAAVHSRMTGVVTPEGDAADDSIPVESTVKPAESKEKLFGGATAGETGTAPAAKTPSAPKDAVKAKPNPEPAAVVSPTPPAESEQQTIAQGIGEMMEKAGVPFDDFLDYTITQGYLRARERSNVKTYDDLPQSVAEKLFAAPGALAACARTFGTKKP